MKFPPSFLEEIKARLPVSEVVRRRVKLQKAGREWKGLSPFNSEKTPSFFVNDQKQAWFDFSSGRNGSVFDFLMLTEGVSFPEAVERLASMAGLQLPQESPESAEREKKRAGLQEVLELAAKFFEEQLQGRAGAKARGYLADRGLPPAIQKEFRLGYAPGEKFALREWLAGRGATVETMIEAGLLIRPAGKRDSTYLVSRFLVNGKYQRINDLQASRRGASWEVTIRTQRRGILRRLDETPSLRAKLNQPAWWSGVWDDGVAQAAQETGLADFPEICPWSAEQVLALSWYPHGDTLDAGGDA